MSDTIATVLQVVRYLSDGSVRGRIEAMHEFNEMSFREQMALRLEVGQALAEEASR